MHAGSGRHRLANRVRRYVQFHGQLSGSRRMAQGLGEHRFRPQELRTQILQMARRPDHPAPVPQVPLEFSGDGGRRVGRKAGSAARVEASCGLDQAEVGDLVQVRPIPPERLKPRRQRLGQIEVFEYELVFKGLPDPALDACSVVPVAESVAIAGIPTLWLVPLTLERPESLWQDLSSRKP